MFGKMKGATVAITGASSGIGRATAARFASCGSNLVLISRNGEALTEAAEECAAMGVDVEVVVADVADEAAIDRAAQRAVDRFGSLDVWVNNAGVSLFGRFEETPSDDWRQVIETNLFGYVHGARAAVRRFREQGHGVLINVSSHVGRAPIPYVSAYIASKFAIDGLTTSLREELDLDGVDIHACTVMPPSVDTPLFQHAANYTGRAIKPVEPVYEADEVARAIVSCARRPRPEVSVGGSALTAALPRLLAPRLFERRAARMTERDHFQDQSASIGQGNLYAPDTSLHDVSGGWLAPRQRSGPSTAATLAGLATLAAGAILAFGLFGSQEEERESPGWGWATDNLLRFRAA